MKKKKVGIFYHYLALYRLPVFEELMKSDEVEYTIFSGNTSEFEIKKIDELQSSKPLSEGGLRWKLFSNAWLLKGKFLWQHGLLAEVLRSDLDVFVFLGSPYHISTWIGAALARLKGKKVYYWMHGIYRDKLGLADYLKLHAFYKLANGCLLYGNRAADILRERYKQGNYKIHVIYNSLDYRQSLAMRRIVAEREILEFRDFYFKDAALPIITFIGRLTLAKRIDLLIDAQHLLKERFGQTRFNILIIGAGSEMDNLVARSSFHGLSDNIKFLGAIYDEAEIAGILMHSDICVTPGEVGLTAIHSLSYGTPVISHNNFNIQMPEVEAIKPGINGDLYEWKNGSAMAAKISAWLEKYPIKSKETFEKCYAVIDNYYNPMYQVKIMNDAFRD